ncbi:MAG: pilus assembly protein N-terminal domain-containing protein [Magnetospirillum sp.]|nr:pilus assembly protein N-terminal domain-containing protein [Magnetospirillum sp.]
MGIVRQFGLVATLMMAAAGLAHAQDRGDIVDVPMQGAVRIDLDQPARNVVLGNPGIADVTVETERTLYVFGKVAGATTLSVLGRGGTVVMEATLVVMPGGKNSVTVTYGQIKDKEYPVGGWSQVVDCGTVRCSAPRSLAKESAGGSSSTKQEF